MEATGSPLMTLLLLFIFAAFFFMLALGLSTFLLTIQPLANLMPPTYYDGLVNIYVSFFGLFDKSFIFLALAVIGSDVLLSIIDPSMGMAIFNLMTMFLFAFIVLNVRTPFLSVFNSIGLSQALPETGAILANNWFLGVVFFAIVLCVGFNFTRHRPSVPYRHDYSQMGNQSGFQQ